MAPSTPPPPSEVSNAAPRRSPPQVLVEEKSCGRIFMLNRPKQLNALSGLMVSCLLELFLICAQDSSVKLIILKGKGKAFCAGGDVAAVVRDIAQGKWKSGADYFRKLYTLSYIIATHSKPQVSILNGIVMGGGAGISIHGGFRIATENSLFAMPETDLGLFPDIGASYFLSRLPGFFGEYVGLTGARLDGAEMLACGLATHLVQSERLPLLEKALVKADSSDPVVISTTIGEFSHAPNLKKNSTFCRLDIINKCFSQRTVEEIIAALEREAADKKDDWISSTIQSLKKASPMSLKVSLRSVPFSEHYWFILFDISDVLSDSKLYFSLCLCGSTPAVASLLHIRWMIREGRLQSIGKCLIREFRIVCHMMLGDVSKDFIEGCRAILLDKDKNPKWEPPKLESISDEMVDRYFSKVDDDDDWEDLKLTVSSKFPAYVTAKL